MLSFRETELYYLSGIPNSSCSYAQIILFTALQKQLGGGSSSAVVFRKASGTDHAADGEVFYVRGDGCQWPSRPPRGQYARKARFRRASSDPLDRTRVCSASP
jgi:hypothetical protein